MKKNLFLFFVLMSTRFTAQVCNASGDLMIFTNYDGGTLTINVDQNIPNLKIGICSYEAIRIVLTGAFVNNVSAVRYAGYNGTNNTGCGAPSIPTTTIIGAPVTAVTSTVFAPTSPLANTNGYGSIICGYSCSNNTNQGGCNTVDQIEAYFLGYFNGSTLLAHKVQYGCWTGTQSVSAGGTCCPPLTVLPGGIASSQSVCPGQAPSAFTSTLAASAGTAAVTYTWQSSTTSASSGFSNINSANSSTYVPGAVNVTTYYRRAASSGTGAAVFSNVISVTALAPPALVISPAQTGICPGATLQLLASGASSYTWLPSGSNSASQMVSVAGTYTLTGTAANSCTAAITKSISQFSSPQISVSGPTFVCNGITGTWTASGANTYSWISGTSGTTTGTTFSPQALTGPDNFTIVGMDINGCVASTQFSVQYSLPSFFSVTINNPAPCLGDIITLTASNNGLIYNWQPGNFSGISNTVTVTGNTNYTITAINSLGCVTTVNYLLGFNPAPQINLSVLTQPVCSGQVATLIANGAMSYTWQPGNLAGSSVTINPTQSITYTVTGFDICYTTKTLSILVIPTPTLNVVATRSAICSGEQTKLSVSGATTYVWTTPAGNNSSASINVSPAVTTVYTVSGSVGNGCDAKNSYTLNVSTCNGLQETPGESANWRVFPNPSGSVVTFTSDSEEKLEIYNAVGQLLDAVNIGTGQIRSASYSFNATGIYFIKGSGKTVLLVIE